MPRKILGVIPARYASSRFPGKALARIGSKSMLQHVYERVSLARYLTSVVIATDDERICEEARRFGAPVRMTRDDHLSGTDRVAEVASADSAEWVVNIQGDEPLIDPAAIDAAILPLLDEPTIPMGTLKKRIEDPREIDDPNVVKVVTDRVGNAIYFSRSTDSLRARQGKRQSGAGLVHYKHIGLYVYRRDFLLALSGVAGGAARTGRAAGATACARERLPDPGGGDGVRIARRGYARGSGEGLTSFLKQRWRGVITEWLNIFS